MKRVFLGSHPLSTDLAALFLRLAFGGLFIWHGYEKIENYDLWITMSKSLIGLGTVIEYNLVTYTEFIGGILITIGFLTRLAVIPIAISMSVAYFVAHKADAFMMKELPFLFLCLTPVVFLLGSGAISVDRLLFRKYKTA